MLLAFDTETSGLPLDYNAAPSPGRNWPRLVTLAWVVADDQGRELEAQHHLIRPDGWKIDAEAERIHGISTAHAIQHGRSLGPVLGEFQRVLLQAGGLICHNVRFDSAVVGSEYLRLGLENRLPRYVSCCTMERSTDFCKLPGKREGSYKWPRLAELHCRLFGAEHDKQHDALGDVRACLKCWVELKRLGVLE
jgi:DNA polymerase III epsilon subunit-like protein